MTDPRRPRPARGDDPARPSRRPATPRPPRPPDARSSRPTGSRGDAGEPRRRPPASSGGRETGGGRGGPPPRGGTGDRPAGPPGDRTPDRPDGRSGSGRPRRLPVEGRTLAGLLVVGVLALLVLVALGVRATHSGTALPGTSVAGIGVGGASPSEIRRRLQPELSGDRTLLLRADGRLLRLKLRDAGYRVDLDDTARAAVEAGRGGFLFGLPSTLWGLVAGRTSPVEADVDRSTLRKALARIERQVGRKPFPGALSVDPTTLDVTTKSSRAGQAVDRDRLTVRADRELMAGRLGPIDVPLTSVPGVSDRRLDQLADQARAALKAPLRLTGAGAPLTLRASEQAELLALQSRDGGRKAELGVGVAPLRALLDRIEKRGSRAPKDARISAPAAAAGGLTEKGDVQWKPQRTTVTSGTARTGRAVVRGKLATAIRAAVADGKRTVRVPVTTIQPRVTTADAQRVRWLIGTFTTPYTPGQPRVTNIQRMARTVDGTVVPPGGTFSLNGITGERTTAKGYVEAPFIAGNKIEPSVGGGVSQFSTTIYNAAYFAGLQIDAFRAHSLFIDRYPPGRESTLNFPDIDMRWTNDTSAPVVVRTSFDDSGVTVSLYGDNGRRRVSAKAGEREPVEDGNFQITVTRTVRYADGRTVEQPVTTRYANEVTDDPPDDSSEADPGADSGPAGDAAAGE